MLRPRRAVLCLLLALVVALAASGPAHACSGPPSCPRGPDVIFRGRVLAFEDHAQHELLQFVAESLNLSITAEFEVIEAWKGVQTRTVRLHAERFNCGPVMEKLEPGTEMLVMAANREGKLVADECNRPIPVDSEVAQKMLAELGPGTRDLPSSFSHMISRVGPWLLVMFGLSVGWWWRRRRANRAQTDA
jgi:hypothetical protein